GLLVNVEGVNAFVPLSQIVGGPERGNPEQTQKSLTEWVGKGITLKVIELNRRRNRAILSERAAVQERRAAEKERLLKELIEGDVRTGRITSIRDFGVFVDVGGADGLVHLSELSWERTPKTPNDLFKVGEEVSVYILKVDQESKKIALSIRRAQPERWIEIVSRYREGQIVAGQVTKLAPFGAFVRLEGPIEGLVHISELVDRRINHPKEVVDEDDVVPVKIVRIEQDRHRLGLSLRQARDKAEADGWIFNDSGGVDTAPQEALDALGVTATRRPDVGVEDSSPEPASGSDAEAPTETAGPSQAEANDVDAAPEGAEADMAETPVVAAEASPTVEVTDEPDVFAADAASEEEATEATPEDEQEEAATEAPEAKEAEEPIAEGPADAEVAEDPEPEAVEDLVADVSEEPAAAEATSEDEVVEASPANESVVEPVAEAPESEEAKETIAEVTEEMQALEESDAVAEADVVGEETSPVVADGLPVQDKAGVGASAKSDESGETEEKTSESDAEPVTEASDEALNNTKGNRV
ncbi:MAG: S1 RNA-binding domain-containing protein, partial [Dehalococcoidia bacterium]